jgi:hypothetical protein
MSTVPVSDSIAVADPPKPPRKRTPRNPSDQAAQKPSDQATQKPDGPPPKSLDPSLAKASFYLPKWLLRKLAVASVIRGKDQSDIVTAVLTPELSSVTFYDRTPRSTDQTLPVTEIGSDVAA